MTEERRSTDPHYGHPDQADPHMGEGGREKDDVESPEQARERAERHARESAEEAAGKRGGEAGGLASSN